MSSPTQILQNVPIDLHSYEDLYRHFHAHPELSLHEAQTARTIANHHALQSYAVHEAIGGHGVAAVLSNGAGPTVLLRADMDALPVKEETGLPYASTVRMVDKADGLEKPVMHACGHDMHITCLLAAAQWLADPAVRETWSGTLVLVFQPNEERGKGARAMVDDGLYQRVPVPDVVLGQHVMVLRSGKVAVRKGAIMTAADTFKVTLYGRGGHGSMPHLCIDPVLLAAQVVVRLQGIVSREVDPAELAVVTVGSIQAGQTENVIASEAVLGIDMRSITGETREKMVRSIRRIVEAECDASGCPKRPTFEETRKFPLTVNDASATERLSDAFGKVFGQDFDPEGLMSNASEDVSDLATSVGVPYCFWFFGGIDGQGWDKAEREGKIKEDIPCNHSPFFAPTIQPTLKTGVETLVVAAMTFLNVT